MNNGTPRSNAMVVAVAALALAALALGYLGWKTLSPAPVQIVEKLNIALPVAPQHALMHLAAAKGYFAEEGLDVNFLAASHGAVAIKLLGAGKADIAVAAEVPVAIAVMKGEDLAIAASILSAANAHAVIARRDRGIAAPGDLVGKKIGATLGTSGDYFLWAFLIRHKLAPESVTLVDLPPGQIAQALASGAVDAAVTWHPYVRNARDALGDNAISFADDNVYTQSVVLAARGDFLKQHRGAMEKLVRALLKAERLTRSQPDASLESVAAWLKLDIEALRPVWKNLDLKVDLLQSQLITLEDEARWAMARGYVPAGPVPNFLPNLYLDALVAVDSARVTVVR